MKKLPANTQVEFLRDLVEYNIRAIVEHQNLVSIKCDVTPARVVLSIFVAPSDIGLVLGNDGATANALRRIVWTACKKTDFRCDIDFVTNGQR
jgi:predicted RNA-binding protein YlqC (UPF0109 family)